MPQFLHSTSRGVAEGPWASWPLLLRFPTLVSVARDHPWLLRRGAKSMGAWTLGLESSLHQLLLLALGLPLPFLLDLSLSFPIFPKGLV